MVIFNKVECDELLYGINTNWQAIKNNQEYYDKYVVQGYEDKLTCGYTVIFAFEDLEFLKKLTKL